MHIRIIATTLCLSLFCTTVHANQQGCSENNNWEHHTLSTDDATEILKRIGGNVLSVKQAPVKGIFELLVEKDGRHGIIYIDYEKKNLIQGLVINLETLHPITAHMKELSPPKQVTSLDPMSIPVDKSVVMGNPDGRKKLYVFTDPDCPYCLKMHTELKKLEKIAPDVAIHVLLFPLEMHPAAYDKSRVILETNSLDLLDKAFEGEEMPAPSMESSKASIDAIMKFAGSEGIAGTPTLVLTNGKIIVGIQDAESLKKMLEEM